MPRGTIVGLGPGNIVLDVDPAAPQGTQPLKFQPSSVVAKWQNGSRCHLIRR